MKPLMLPAIDILIRQALKRAGRCAYCGNKRELCATKSGQCIFRSRPATRKRVAEHRARQRAREVA